MSSKPKINGEMGDLSLNEEVNDIKMIKIQSADGKMYEWPEEMAKMSVTIKELMTHATGDCDAIPIPLPNVGSAELDIVQNYCRYHFENDDKLTKDVLHEWEMKFLDIDRTTLKAVIMAANYLDIEPLLDGGIDIFLKDIQGKSVEEIRAILGIVCDLSPEMLSQIDRENKWIEPNC